MSTITSLNQYKASYADSTDLTVAAETLADAIEVLADAKQGEPSIIQKTVTGISVAIPSPAIAVKTTVVGSGASEAGCKATPYSIDSVEKGDKVWFTAITAEGFTFTGWYLDDELLSTEESYEATIAYTGQTPTILEYEARFVVV
jgi:hypothetical protein